MRQKLIELQREIDYSIFIVGGFNTPLSEIHRSSREKINQDIVELNNTINGLNIIDIHRLLHPTTAEYTFFLKLTWNIHQNKTHSRPENTP